MPYVNKPRPYKKEWAQEQARDEKAPRAERAKARAAFDAKNGKSARKGKDLSHKKDLARGGSNADGVFLEAPSTNRARGGAIHKPTPKQ